MQKILSIPYKVFVMTLILVTIPLIILIGMAIWITSGLPIFFIQKRIGKDRKVFALYKFRTMIPNAEEKKNSLKKQNEADGPVFKIHNDPRFTPLGAFLSHTGLDELPQIFNIAEGNMAFLGPRPLPVDEEQQLTSWQQKRSGILPGIISPWIMEGYHSTTFSSWMNNDIAYIREKSVIGDVQICFRFFLHWIKLVGLELQRPIRQNRGAIDNKKKKQYT